nr:hypothetical protein GTC16762_07830 [Pigmentibacter ruber]
MKEQQLVWSFRKKLFLNLDKIILFLSIILIFLIFSLWDILGCLNGYCNLYSSASVTAMKFSEINSWLPLSFRVSQGNLFPIFPSIDPSASGVSFFPYFSLWFQGLSIKLFGLNGSYIFGHVFFPVFDFILLYLIFRKYVNTLWSVSLSFIALVSFIGLPFRKFLFEVFLGNSQINIATLQSLNVAGFPFPSFSLFCFLGVFILSLENKKISNRRLFFLTAIWALQSQIYVINSIVGLLFWFMFFPIRLKRENIMMNYSLLIRKILIQFIIVIVIVSPTVFAFFNHSRGLSFSELGIISDTKNVIFSDVFVFLYFVFPLLLTISISFISKSDPYEFLYKFSPIIILFLIESGFYIFGIIFNLSIPNTLLFSRLSMVFFHFLYLIPAIYYISFRITTFYFNKNQYFQNYLRKILIFLNTKLSYILLPLIIIFLFLFATISARKNYIHVKNISSVEEVKAHEELTLLTKDLPKGLAVLAENPLVNLMIPISTDNATLWVNRFANNVSQKEVIKRFALIANIFGWSQNEFLKFMQKGQFQDIAQINNPINIDSSNIFNSGVGYWLTMHNSTLSEIEQKKYVEQLIYEYKNIDAKLMIDKYKLFRILSSKVLYSLPDNFTETKTNIGYLYSRK